MKDVEWDFYIEKVDHTELMSQVSHAEHLFHDRSKIYRQRW